MSGIDVFGLNAEGKYEKIDYIKSDDEINLDTQLVIRSRYSIEDEIKLNRLANSLPKAQEPADFAAYHEYIEECRAEGAAKKAAAAALRLALTVVELTQENSQPVPIYVRE